MKNTILTILIASSLVSSSCDGDSNVAAEQTNNIITEETITNTTITGDTTKKDDQIVNLINESVGLTLTIYEGIQKSDSIRNANEQRKWVYQIGDSYNSDDGAAKAYDEIKDYDKDLFVFKKSRRKYYLLKGNGASTKKELEDSLLILENRFNADINLIDLSIVCRKMPQNIDEIKYKIDGEKYEIHCKACE